MRIISNIILRKIQERNSKEQKIKKRIFFINKLRLRSFAQCNVQPKNKSWHKFSFPDNIYCLYITTSSDNKYMFALTTCGIFKSENLGFTWNVCLKNNGVTWYVICSDITGQYIIASAKINVIGDAFYRKSVVFHSENYGQTWELSSYYSQINDNDYLISMKCSDRQSFVLLSMNGYIYESTDYGKNWVTLSIINSWCSSIACSYTNKLLIVASKYSKGCIYVSKDYGINWIKQLDISCNLITASNCCKYLACTSNSNLNGGIYVSNDYGTTWIRTLSLSCNWTSITMDYTGKSVYASSSDDGIYFSDNYGVSWVKLETVFDNWNCFTVNEDGSRLVASTLNYSKKISDIYVYA